MPIDPESLKQTPDEPSDKLQKLAEALLAMPVGKWANNFEDLLHGKGEQLLLPGTSPDVRDKLLLEYYGSTEIYDRTAEVADALDLLRKNKHAAIDRPLYPNDPNYKMTVRDALQQLPQIVQAFQQFIELTIKDTLWETATPEEYIETANILRIAEDRPPKDPSDPNACDDARSQGSRARAIFQEAGRCLDQISIKAEELLGALPPMQAKKY